VYDYSEIDILADEVGTILERGGFRVSEPSKSDNIFPLSSLIILEAIAKAESPRYEEPNYKVTYNYNSFNRNVDITKLRISQILKLQKQVVSKQHTNNKRRIRKKKKKMIVSSAMGAFMFMQKGLRNLRYEAPCLRNNPKFDKLTQLKLAEYYMTAYCGYRLWQRGMITDKKFLNNLSNIWAAIPNTTGRSTLNQGVGTTPKKFLAILRAAKQYDNSIFIGIKD
jgi:hypothetical protein